MLLVNLKSIQPDGVTSSSNGVPLTIQSVRTGVMMSIFYFWIFITHLILFLDGKVPWLCKSYNPLLDGKFSAIYLSYVVYTFWVCVYVIVIKLIRPSTFIYIFGKGELKSNYICHNMLLASYFTFGKQACKGKIINMLKSLFHNYVEHLTNCYLSYTKLMHILHASDIKSITLYYAT